ncbi:MAG: elongation factor P [Patescibacteria group bacterium]|jgi:elongation factor P
MAISSLNDIKKGKVLDIDNQPYLVVEANFVRMQQRKPVMQTKLKSLITNKVIENNFHPGDRVEEADLTHRRSGYLYSDPDHAYFMNNETYEQFGISLEQMGDQARFLKEGMEVDALYYNGEPVSVELPGKVNLKVVQTIDGARGDTAQGKVTKPATMETGFDVNVPLFIKEGDVIKVNTETGEYLERVNE